MWAVVKMGKNFDIYNCKKVGYFHNFEEAEKESKKLNSRFLNLLFGHRFWVEELD